MLVKFKLGEHVAVPSRATVARTPNILRACLPREGVGYWYYVGKAQTVQRQFWRAVLNYSAWLTPTFCCDNARDSLA